MTAPAVSVIMPTYNQAWFLRHALDSIAAQTYRDFELIVVDDGSTDETRSILGGMTAESWPAGFLKVRQEPNMGTAAAINTGTARARGRYWTWVSSDNLMNPLWLDRLVATLEYGPVVDKISGVRAGGPAGCAYAGFWWVQSTRDQMVSAHASLPSWRDIEGAMIGCAASPLSPGCRYLHEPYDPARQIAQEACYLGPAHLVRREAWAEHRGRISHDLDAFLRIEEACWERGLPIVGVDEPLCVYFAHGERATVTRRAEYDAPHWLAEARKRRGIE